jgi:hypothetical protein
MRIVIDTDTSATPAVSTVQQSPGALSSSDQVNAGAAPGGGGDGVGSDSVTSQTASTASAVDAGQAPEPSQPHAPASSKKS